jgi:hypothetical protein
MSGRPEGSSGTSRPELSVFSRRSIRWLGIASASNIFSGGAAYTPEHRRVRGYYAMPEGTRMGAQKSRE